ncbi:MAG: BolA/IbaG family iron-sulfur metabolism protein [Candidatus Eremiobacteraeota bacterium]|nr:BolA/IbaG family iron-sulfur metabolism protein [Candidatus Eremiobacteraeota bacterium]
MCAIIPAIGQAGFADISAPGLPLWCDVPTGDEQPRPESARFLSRGRAPAANVHARDRPAEGTRRPRRSHRRYRDRACERCHRGAGKECDATARSSRRGARNRGGAQFRLAATAIVIDDESLRALIRGELPDAQVSIVDRTGTMDHFNVTVRSKAFAGKTLIDQHKLIYAALRAALNDGRIHAVELTTIVAEG